MTDTAPGAALGSTTRRKQWTRLGAWAGLATVAVFMALISAQTEAGIRRLASALDTEAVAERSAAPMTAKLTARPFDAEIEARRLNEAVRILAADRDRLLSRIGALERSLDDVTGSISPTTATPGPSASPLPPSLAPQATLPQIPAVPPPVMAAPRATPAPQTAPPANAPPATLGNRVATAHVAVTGASPATESVATKTEFGIDVGGNTSVDGLRTLWANLKANQPALFEGLRPVIAVRDGAKTGAIELRLVAGPLANAGAAARLCAALAAANVTCQPAVFDGQRLALQ